MVTRNPIDVFISSTCYDLVDLRADLRQFLEANGVVVRLSEDPQSAFYVEPSSDSITSCLKNVESSDIVVVVIDRRYGPVLPVGTEHAGISATHAEVKHAIQLKKPIRYFIREAALVEYNQLRQNLNFDTRWVEPKNPLGRIAWFTFVKELFTLPEHADRSNWYDSFRSSVDLKPLTLRRLVDIFPHFRGDAALHPDKYVRLTFLKTAVAHDRVRGAFHNVGVGPALDISHGLSDGTNELTKFSLGGLMEGGVIATRSEPYFSYMLQGSFPSGTLIFCEYSNRYGDRYRIHVPLIHNPASLGAADVGTEELYVRRDFGGASSWDRVPI